MAQYYKGFFGVCQYLFSFYFIRHKIIRGDILPAKNKKEAAMRLMPALFMLLLLIQTAFIIFDGTEPSGTAADIDIVTRTSCSALYAYFLSTAASIY